MFHLFHSFAVVFRLPRYLIFVILVLHGLSFGFCDIYGDSNIKELQERMPMANEEFFKVVSIIDHMFHERENVVGLNKAIEMINEGHGRFDGKAVVIAVAKNKIKLKKGMRRRKQERYVER